VAECDKGFLKHVIDISKQRIVIILFMFVLDSKELFVSIVDGNYMELKYIRIGSSEGFLGPIKKGLRAAIGPQATEYLPLLSNKSEFN
jgi:hypothetical protein